MTGKWGDWMKQFWKLNAVSMLYALMIAIPVELMLNVYRISRVMNLEIGTVNIITGIILLLEMTLGRYCSIRSSRSGWEGRIQITGPLFCGSLILFCTFTGLRRFSL